jgi:predicted metal-dependent peptidase
MSLLQSDPFFATLLLQMPRVAVGPEVCAMAATDGEKFFYNPAGVESLTFDVVRTLQAHEVMHVAMLHHTRMDGKDPKLANIAGDHVINLILQESGFVPWEGWLCDHRFEGQTFDQVYATLAREQQQGGGGGGQQPPQQSPPSGPSAPGGQQPPQPGDGKSQSQQSKGGDQQQPGNQPGGQQPPQAASTPGGYGQILPCPKEEQGKQEQEWKMAVEQAATAARAAGKLPGHLAKLVEELRESHVPWADLLRQFIAQQIPTDFTWSRPSRRTISQDIYLPSLTKEGLGDLVFAIDMSGSCLSYTKPFCSEIAVVHQDLKPSRLTMLTFDTRVHDCGEFGPGDDIEFNLKGGGGTDFRPIFDRIDQMDSPPRAVVILTDLLGPFPSEAPNYPVLWVSTRKRVAPFGETAHMEAE